MANSFEYNSEIVRDSAIILADNLVAANLCQRQVAESKFAEQIGKSVKVKRIPDLGYADEFTGTTTASDVTEDYITIELEKHFYKKITLTSDQKTLEVDDFMAVVGGPAILSVAESIDNYFIDQMAKGFAQNLVGTAGSSPVTIAAILAGRKKIRDNRGTYKNVAAIIDTAAEAAFLALAQFTNADYGVDRPVGLREASLGRMHGATYFSSQHAGALTRGDIAGTVLIDGDPGTTTTIHIDGLTAATGTIYRGTRFTVADDTSATVYTVIADATIASNECDLSVYPAADASIADGKAVTFEAAMKKNILYNTNAVYGAIVAPKPFSGVPSAVESVNGLSVRTSFFSDGGGLSDTYIVDVYAGCEVVHVASGAVFQAA
jgi:hypothetical protein